MNSITQNTYLNFNYYYYTVIQKTGPPNTLWYSTVISQHFLPKVYEMFEKVRGCGQQLNLRATLRRRMHLTL